MTARKLKRQVQKTESYFFDYWIMLFFNDTIRDFYVPKRIIGITDALGDTYQCYVLKHKHSPKNHTRNTSYFDVKTFNHVLPR